jgi:hypothetical protein
MQPLVVRLHAAVTCSACDNLFHITHNFWLHCCCHRCSVPAGKKPAAAKTATGGTPAAAAAMNGRGAAKVSFLEEDEAEEEQVGAAGNSKLAGQTAVPMEVEGGEGEAATTAPAAGGGKRRQFRSKASS